MALLGNVVTLTFLTCSLGFIQRFKMDKAFLKNNVSFIDDVLSKRQGEPFQKTCFSGMIKYGGILFTGSTTPKKIDNPGGLWCTSLCKRFFTGLGAATRPRSYENLIGFTPQIPIGTSSSDRGHRRNVQSLRTSGMIIYHRPIYLFHPCKLIRNCDVVRLIWL